MVLTSAQKQKAYRARQADSSKKPVNLHLWFGARVDLKILAEEAGGVSLSARVEQLIEAEMTRQGGDWEEKREAMTQRQSAELLRRNRRPIPIHEEPVTE